MLGLKFIGLCTIKKIIFSKKKKKRGEWPKRRRCLLYSLRIFFSDLFKSYTITSCKTSIIFLSINYKTNLCQTQSGWQWLKNGAVSWEICKVHIVQIPLILFTHNSFLQISSPYTMPNLTLGFWEDPWSPLGPQGDMLCISGTIYKIVKSIPSSTKNKNQEGA